MASSFTLSVRLTAKPEAVYRAWLDSHEHAAFTGSPAKIDSRVGGTFSVWDGYITGRTDVLEPPSRIVQSWRTTEFPEEAPDSRVEIILKGIPSGTQLTLKHSQIPEGQAEEYKQGWKDYYFSPLTAYFHQEPWPRK